jgi:Flp pilus assembly pilin Flp
MFCEVFRKSSSSSHLFLANNAQDRTLIGRSRKRLAEETRGEEGSPDAGLHRVVRCGPTPEWVWPRGTRNAENWEPDMRKIVAFLKDDAGTETLEWGLVCGLIVVGAITMIALIGPKVTDMWNDMNNAVPAAD